MGLEAQELSCLWVGRGRAEPVALEVGEAAEIARSLGQSRTLREPGRQRSPANIIEELRRDMARLALVREQISSIEKTRAERLARAPDTGPHAMVRLLARVIGIGIETADMLVREI